jgi:nucleoside-diphosphate-sugar epimerase
MEKFQVSVLFGGLGFIGGHFARYLLTNELTDTLYLVDIVPSNVSTWPIELQEAYKRGRVHCIQLDVRQPISATELPSHAELVANFAAVHREPGHEPHEYFTTNLRGAEHVAWAEQIGCPWIVFTSSIAPYGPTEDAKEETAIPSQCSIWASKVAAEKSTWRQRGGQDRQLTIVRPGVVVAGEGRNVTV